MNYEKNLTVSNSIVFIIGMVVIIGFFLPIFTARIDIGSFSSDKTHAVVVSQKLYHGTLYGKFKEEINEFILSDKSDGRQIQRSGDTLFILPINTKAPKVQYRCVYLHRRSIIQYAFKRNYNIQ